MIVDLDQPLPEAVIEEIKKLNCVIRVRIFA